MNTRYLYAVALAGLCASMPMSAQAADYHVIYDGTITDGADVDAIFGVPGRDLTGLGLRADVTYSTSAPGTRATDATSDEVAGGEAFMTAPVISSAVFTIGAASLAISPTYYGDVYTSAAFLDAYGLDLLGNNFETYILPTMAAPIDLATLFTSTGVGDTGGRLSQYSFLVSGNDDIDFDATNVSVAPVPEPATWATMLAGFGVLGFAARRRNKAGRLAPSR